MFSCLVSGIVKPEAYSIDAKRIIESCCERSHERVTKDVESLIIRQGNDSNLTEGLATIIIIAIKGIVLWTEREYSEVKLNLQVFHL